MQQEEYGRRRISLLIWGMLLVLSAGVAAATVIETPLRSFLPVETFSLNVASLPNTGFTMRSLDGSLFTLEGSSKYDLQGGPQPGDTVQEGFVLLDGTLSVDVSALKGDGTRPRFRSIYRMDLRPGALRRESLARKLVLRGVVRGLDPQRSRALALKRAGAIGLDDARIMRRVPRPEGGARWMRAVRGLGVEELRFRSRKSPDGVIGHFGTSTSELGDPYVWAVLDRNSRFAVGVTLDRDGDGVPNASDNCIGTPNANQSNADTDASGDACDSDDDDDQILDAADNCPLTANHD